MNMSFLLRLRARHLGVLCVVGGVPALGISTVHATETSDGNKVKISQLPIYEVPGKESKFKVDDLPVSTLQEYVSPVRQAVWEYLDSMQETTQAVKNKYEVAKAHTMDLVKYVQEDPSILPKASVITVAGLGGIVAGYRGGVLRKAIFSGTAIAAATALCYPNETVALTTDAYNTVYNYGKSVWDAESKSPEESPPPAQTETKPDRKKLEDHGQSNPADKDMYTTRGS